MTKFFYTYLQNRRRKSVRPRDQREEAGCRRRHNLRRGTPATPPAWMHRHTPSSSSSLFLSSYNTSGSLLRKPRDRRSSMVSLSFPCFYRPTMCGRSSRPFFSLRSLDFFPVVAGRSSSFRRFSQKRAPNLSLTKKETCLGEILCGTIYVYMPTQHDVDVSRARPFFYMKMRHFLKRVVYLYLQE